MIKISSAEWEVMRVLWAKGETTSADIIRILSDKQGWSASTVKTLLGRLAEKGYLTSYRQGRSFIYQTSLSEEEANLGALRSVLDRICQTKQVDLISHLLTDLPMTQEDVVKLQKQLKNKDVVAVVNCDCLPGQCVCSEHLEVSNGS